MTCELRFVIRNLEISILFVIINISQLTILNSCLRQAGEIKKIVSQLCPNIRLCASFFLNFKE